MEFCQLRIAQMLKYLFRKLPRKVSVQFVTIVKDCDWEVSSDTEKNAESNPEYSGNDFGSLEFPDSAN